MDFSFKSKKSNDKNDKSKKCGILMLIIYSVLILNFVINDLNYERLTKECTISVPYTITHYDVTKKIKDKSLIEKYIHNINIETITVEGNKTEKLSSTEKPL